MAQIFNYGLVGVGPTVQYGKGGNRIQSGTGSLTLLQPTGSSRVSLNALNGDFDGTLTVDSTSTLTGTVTIGANSQILADPGTAALPGVAFTGTGGNANGLALVSNDLVLSVAGAASLTLNDVTDTTNAVATFGGTSAIVLPSGNNAARPTGATGMIRVNTETSTHYVEFWDGDSWESIIGSVSSFATFSLTGNTSGDSSIVADNASDTLTLTGGIGITLTGNAATDTITVSFTNAGMADTAVVLADTVPFFDASNSNEAEFRSFANIFADLDVANGFTANGILVRTASDVYASRTLTASTTSGQEGIVVTNGDGVSGNPTVGLDINGLTAENTLTGSDEFVIWEDTAGANRKITAQNVRNYMTQAVDPLVRRAASVNINDAVNIASALPSTANVYVTRIVINVTTAAVGGVNGRITDGTNVLVVASEWDWNTVGVYVIELPLAVNSTNGQLAFAFDTAPTTAGVATVTAEYKIAA